jgi:hypothetical protein
VARVVRLRALILLITERALMSAEAASEIVPRGRKRLAVNGDVASIIIASRAVIWVEANAKRGDVLLTLIFINPYFYKRSF